MDQVHVRKISELQGSTSPKSGQFLSLHGGQFRRRVRFVRDSALSMNVMSGFLRAPSEGFK